MLLSIYHSHSDKNIKTIRNVEIESYYTSSTTILKNDFNVHKTNYGFEVIKPIKVIVLTIPIGFNINQYYDGYYANDNFNPNYDLLTVRFLNTNSMLVCDNINLMSYSCTDHPHGCVLTYSYENSNVIYLRG